MCSDYFAAIIVFSLLILGFLGENTIQAGVQEASPFLLPKDLRPTHYKVHLQPEIGGNFSLKGFVQIHFDVRRPTNKVVLHADQLTIFNDSLKVISDDDGSELISIGEDYDEEYQFYIVYLAEYLLKDSSYTFQASFEGLLRSDLAGFYRTHHRDEEGIIRHCAATQFQPTSARSAFPCFDEPEIKATFDVVLRRPNNLTALSNMPLKQTLKINDAYSEDHFERSVPMSTYLLAFVICDMVERRIQSSSLKTELRMWTREEVSSQTGFGGVIAEKGLVFLEDYFNLSFPLPKLDMVAVTQMGPNAMENWGLIISRESGLLQAPGGSIEHLKWVAYLISHELAHQWFGNLVTMKWWTDLWLNEGFATYVGYMVVDKVKPSWGIMNSFVVNILQGSMILDELDSAPPVRVTVHHPDDIRATFSKISYHKGGSILRMMKHFLGEDTFRKGLNLYLSELKYKSAEQDDLWHFVTKAAHSDGSISPSFTVKEIMDSWTLQPGFPILHVTFSNNTIHFSQSPFRLGQTPSKAPTPTGQSKLWWIPVSWVHQGRPDFHMTRPKLWLYEKQRTFVDDTLDSSDGWILVNPKQNGFYRVSYDQENWAKLIQQLKTDHLKIHPINRAQLVDDAFNLAKIGILEYETVLDLFSYLQYEENSIPWSAALKNLAYLDGLMQHTSHYGVFKDYLLALMSPLYDSLMQTDEKLHSLPKLDLKENILKWACHVGHAGCVQLAVSLVQKWIADPTTNDSQIIGHLSEAAFCTAIREGDKDTWELLWSFYTSSGSVSSAIKEHILRGLACSNQVWILTRFLEFTLHDNMEELFGLSKVQNAPLFYELISSNPVGLYLVWNHLKEHWIEIRNTFGNAMFALPGIVATTTNRFITEQLKQELIAFKMKYAGSLGSAESAVNQAIETTQNNIEWKKKCLGSIVTWLKTQNFSSLLVENFFK